MGLDSVYVLDQANRPNDNGTEGETYTASVFVVQNGQISEEYEGSSYPNSVSNTDNSTDYNTLNEGNHEYNNSSGHDGGTEQGLNIVDENDSRTNAPGTDPDGNNVTMEYVNVHEGASDNGNYNSRGSQGCITLNPDDATDFMDNFNWSGEGGNTGTSTGTLILSRGNNANTINNLKARRKWQQNPAQPIKPKRVTRVTNK
jgi:hypothetical protein